MPLNFIVPACWAIWGSVRASCVSVTIIHVIHTSWTQLVSVCPEVGVKTSQAMPPGLLLTQIHSLHGGVGLHRAEMSPLSLHPVHKTTRRHSAAAVLKPRDRDCSIPAFSSPAPK